MVFMRGEISRFLKTQAALVQLGQEQNGGLVAWLCRTARRVGQVGQHPVLRLRLATPFDRRSGQAQDKRGAGGGCRLPALRRNDGTVADSANDCPVAMTSLTS